MLEILCITAQPLAELGYPEAHRTPETHIWETKYNQFADVWLKRLIVNVLRKYATGLVPGVTGLAGIQVVYGRKPGAHVLSLVNLYAGMTPAPGAPVPRVGPVAVWIPVNSLPRSHSRFKPST